MRSKKWVITQNGQTLHSVKLNEHDTNIFEEWGTVENVTLLCGMVKTIKVPSYRNNLLASRCKTCCEKTTTPLGVGQPR